MKAPTPAEIAPSGDLEIRPVPLRARLRNRLLLSTVGIAGLILCGLLLWNYLSFRERLTEDAQIRARFLANAAADRIDMTLGRLQSLVDGMAISLNATALDLSLEQVRALQREALRGTPALYGIAFAWLPERKPPGWDAWSPYSYRAEGTLRYTDLGHDNRDYIGQDWFYLPRFLDRPVWTEPYIWTGPYLKTTGVRMVTYSAPVRLPSPDGPVFAGVVTCDIELTWLDRMLAELPLGENGYGFLLSRNGVHISHPIAELTMDESIFSVAEARGDPDLRKAGQAMLSGQPGIRAWVGWANDETSWLAWDRLATTGWTSGVLISQTALNRDIAQLTQIEALAGGGGLLLLLLTVGWIARSITRPITALSEAAPGIAAGHLDEPLPEPKGEDEVARLTAIFRTMRDHLKGYIADLQATTAARERIEGELRIARDIQMDLVPKTFPAFPEREDMDLFAIIEPAREVGGDFYDFLLLDDDHLFLAIGDVSGKGVPAALFMAVTRSLLRAEVKTDRDPGRVLARLNNALAEHNDACMFVTVFCALVSLSDGRVRYVNAGHNPPLWLRADGRVDWIDSPSGVAAGPIADLDYATGQLTLAPGESLLLYTDGVNEAMNADDQEFGNERLHQRMRASQSLSCHDALHALLADIRAHTGEAEQFDDITMMMFRREEAQMNQPKRLTLTNDLSELGRLADWLERFGDAHGIPRKVIHPLNLALDELVTNIIHYAYPDGEAHSFTLELRPLGDRLEAELVDDGIPFNPLEMPDADTESDVEERQIGGLGIHFVRQTMDGVYYQFEQGHNHLRLIKRLAET
ncbi:SpoIIE family protein phosphatase [Thiorhodovibrio frisius]|uniref:Serine phosphatase RsbU, regulator of sigma subunit n=1 Tax=Thiorhodovibrio frisius TaxID=631362 RepID=H8Z1P3_9GAMM|nr:SpoIIE family protein phosphatase [Thiorhodovibrio frisius]EIC21488.1 serine phosphatase RsbU, regulator of sigma subunit [Thiorhodovibrio frisius]WPL24074.1 Phosphoserine phosphatase RsbU [Thiorhodovibrio frisius]